VEIFVCGFSTNKFFLLHILYPFLCMQWIFWILNSVVIKFFAKLKIWLIFSLRGIYFHETLRISQKFQSPFWTFLLLRTQERRTWDQSRRAHWVFQSKEAFLCLNLCFAGSSPPLCQSLTLSRQTTFWERSFEVLTLIDATHVTYFLILNIIFIYFFPNIDLS